MPGRRLFREFSDQPDKLEVMPQSPIRIPAVWLSLAALLLGVFPLRAETVDFESSMVGGLPAGWSTAMTFKALPPRWEVTPDGSAPSGGKVLAQLSDDPTSGRFPLAIYEKASLQDGEIRVKFKPVSGKVDQAAGLVWRYKDENNYYIVRANALEDNVVLYKVENGRRSSLAPVGTSAKTYGVKHTVASQTWSSLGVAFAGSRFSVFFGGEKLFDVEDATFSQPGKVGLWTKADSVTYFDDFEVVGR